MKLVFLFFLMGAWTCWANELTSVFNLQHSGTGRASLEEDLSHLLNPATLSFHKRSKSALAYNINKGNQKIALAITDIKTIIPVGVFYERRWSSRFILGDWDRIAVSVASPVNSLLGLGFNIYRNSIKINEDEDKQVVWNGGVGAIVRLSNKTGLAIHADQLLIQDDKNERQIYLAAYQDVMNLVDLRVDVSYSIQQQEWILRGSASAKLKKFLSLSIGHSWFVEQEKGWLSGGLSFYGPRLQFDYGMESYGIEEKNLILQHSLVIKMLF